MKGAHFKSQLQGKVQLSSTQRGKERKAKVTYLSYNKTIKQDYLKSHAKKFKWPLFKRLPLLLKLFFTSCSFTKPLNLQNLFLSLLHITVIHFDPIFPIAPLQLPKASTVLLNGEAETSALSLLLTSQSIIFAITWVDLYSPCLFLARFRWLLLHWQNSHFHLHTLPSPCLEPTWVPPLPCTSSSSNTLQPHRHVIPDSQCKSALKLLSQTQIQIIWPGTLQSTNTIHLKNQAVWPGIIHWRKFLPCYFRTHQNFWTISGLKKCLCSLNWSYCLSSTAAEMLILVTFILVSQVKIKCRVEQSITIVDIRHTTWCWH